MTITGLYIVKNGEADIARSIESISGACDEIVVIDTGSTDKTVEIVTAQGARVHHFEWVDDFSKARNFALSKVDSDLVIFIDSDEWFIDPLGSDDREYLLGLVKQDYRVFSVLRSDVVNGITASPLYNTRMLCGKLGLHYDGSIHEYITDTNRTFYLPERFLLHHSGYDGALNRQKVERNLALLTKQFETEKDPRIRLSLCFYLARENRIYGNYEESLKHLDIFFDMWNSTKKAIRPLNVGICAYDLAAKLYSDVDTTIVPDDKYFALCRDFIRDIPQHPATFSALAGYYYSRHRNYTNTLDAIARVETAVGKYRIDDYPHDYVGEKEPFANATMRKGNILFDMHQRDKAFDCYASILSRVQPNPGFLRRLLNIISGQPTEDAVAFLSALPTTMTLEYIEMLLTQLLYFPKMREVYMYFAVQHLKISKKQSDISAIATLLAGGDALSVAQIGNTLVENDTITAGVLHLLAVMFSGDKAVFDAMVKWPDEVRLFDNLASGVKQSEFTSVELAILRRTFPIVIFLDDAQIKERFFSIVSGFNFIFAHMILTYCTRSEDYGELLPLVEVDDEKLEHDNRAVFLMLMGRAFRTVGDYQSAEQHLRESYTLNPGSTDTYLELGVLASVAPHLAQGIYAFTLRFREAQGKNTGNESLDSIIRRK